MSNQKLVFNAMNALLRSYCKYHEGDSYATPALVFASKTAFVEEDTEKEWLAYAQLKVQGNPQLLQVQSKTTK